MEYLLLQKWSHPSQLITVDGSEIRRSPVEGTVVEIPLFTTGLIHLRWLFRISAINSSRCKGKVTKLKIHSISSELVRYTYMIHMICIYIYMDEVY